MWTIETTISCSRWSGPRTSTKCLAELAKSDASEPVVVGLAPDDDAAPCRIDWRQALFLSDCARRRNRAGARGLKGRYCCPQNCLTRFSTPCAGSLLTPWAIGCRNCDSTALRPG